MFANQECNAATCKEYNYDCYECPYCGDGDAVSGIINGLIISVAIIGLVLVVVSWF